MNEWMNSMPLTDSEKSLQVISVNGCLTVGMQGYNYECAWCHRVYDCSDIQVICNVILY